MHELGFRQFSDVSATIEFIRMVDRAFDALNVRRPGGLGYKSALTRENVEHFETFVSECVDFFLNLETMHGESIIRSRKSTGFLSFVFCLISLKNVANFLFNSSDLRYILSYKFSQDHIELLFNCVRRCCGWNNNPSALQFSHIFKRLLKRAGVPLTRAIV